MDESPESSQSPLDKLMVDGRHVNNLPATSSYHIMQAAAPAPSLAAIRSSSDKAKTDGVSFNTPPETPSSHNKESNTGRQAPSLSAPSSSTSSCNTPVSPHSLEYLDSVAADILYIAIPRPGTYTHQFQTSSLRTSIVKKCERCVEGLEFKTPSQSVCDDCINNGHGSPTDLRKYRTRLMEEL
ncbi:hypothetical protein EAE96_003320 [Botrytis aclada]|nr:hypothetical protein EAE96_003320 [Botrytis aclada]